jgi:hypothetical protein
MMTGGGGSPFVPVAFKTLGQFNIPPPLSIVFSQKKITAETINDRIWTPGVMARWYSPFWDLKKRIWVQTQRGAGETPATPLPASFTWRCKLLVTSGLPLCFKTKNKDRIA